jgi:hypothetical protein
LVGQRAADADRVVIHPPEGDSDPKSGCKA